MLAGMDLPIDLRFKLSEADYLRAIRSYQFGHPYYWVTGAFVLVSIGAAFYCASSDKPGPGAGAWTLVAVVLGLYLAYNFLVAPSRTYDRFSGALRDKELFYRVTSTGLEVKAEAFQARWDWNLLAHYSETRECFLVYPRHSQGIHILLKRAINGPETETALRDLLKSKLKTW